jgi:hypothetical protein
MTMIGHYCSFSLFLDIKDSDILPRLRSTALVLVYLPLSAFVSVGFVLYLSYYCFDTYE